MKKSIIKTISINFLILYNFIILILFAPSIAYFAYRFIVRNNISNNQLNIRKKYKNRIDLIGPLIEFEKLSYSYNDFIIWRRNSFNGNFININKDGVRESSQPKNPSFEKYIFLGGSTIFGYGVEDKNTIPSIFSKFTNKSVLNLGDTGYTARQSLALYINQILENKLESNKKINIISYDGANDIFQRCKTAVTGLETEQQSIIREKVNIKYGSLNYFFKPWLIIINILKSSGKYSPEAFNCHIDKNKAEYVADTLISTWRNMNEIAKINNHKFTAILQPVIYLEGDKINHDSVDIYGEQFKTVYPIIKEKVKNENFMFLDLTNALADKRKKTYIDFCHLDSEGNNYIADEIKKFIYTKYN